MSELNAQLREAHGLIDRVKSCQAEDLHLDRAYYEKLLEISEQQSYFYGQALAHVNLAGYFQMVGDDVLYHVHSDKAKGIAEYNDYFDVIIEYLKQEGARCVGVCDEMAAMVAYLKGVKVSDEINDKKSCAIFYHHIADLFYESRAYEDAEKYYLKAMELLEAAPHKETDYYRKKILIGLLRLACIREDIKKAKRIRTDYLSIEYDKEILSLLFSEEEVHILLLENKLKEAEYRTKALMAEVFESKIEPLLLPVVYFRLMELTLLVKNERLAGQCLNRIDWLYENANPNDTIRIKKFHIQYAQLFGRDCDGLYEAFYKATQEGEHINRTQTVESFDNQIALYEADKEQQRILEEKTKLQTAVNIDELTKIYNRRYYNKLISKLVRDPNIKSLGNVMIDVDFFKGYNDCYGHLKGDQLLKEVSGILAEKLPEHAFAARYGGDEFACLFIDRSEAEIVLYVQSVIQELDSRNIEHVRNERYKRITLSFGIYNEINVQKIEEAQLIERADRALYEAKKSGRNTYAVFKEQ